MRALDQKLGRDLWRMKGQVVTIALVLAAGVAAVFSLLGTYRSLAGSRDAYYARTGFPDVFVALTRAPEPIAQRLAAIEGVTRVDTRLSERVTFPIPGMLRPAAGRAISLATNGDGTASLRGLVLRSGRAPTPTRADEALVLESFANAHGLEPGDALDAVIAGHRLRLRVTGVVLSPEWVFPVEGAMVASPRQVGVVWLGRDALGALTGKSGAFDEATLGLAPSANPRAVIAAVDRVLDPWGGFGAHDRTMQPSHRVLTNEIEQMKILALQVPIVFLIVAAFLLNVVLGRIVHLQREQFAVLRAVGYTRWAIGRHVLAFASVIVVLGAGLGLWFGVSFGRLLMGVYADFFHFPVLELQVDLDLAVIGIGVSGGAAFAGGLIAAWRAIRLAPAEAMRPPVPARYRQGLLSRLGLARLFGPTGRMVLREVERRPASALVSIVGIAFAAALVIMGRFALDSFDHLLDVTLARAMRYDLMVSLAEPTSQSALSWLRQAPGVLAVEPARVAPVRLVHEHRHYDTAITGLRADARLWRVLDGDDLPVVVPAEGLMMSEALATRLDVAVGDRVTIERKDGDHATLALPIAALVNDRQGMNVYMDFHALARALGEEPMLTTASLSIVRTERARLLATLADVPGIVAISDARELREAMSAQTGDMMGIWTLVVVIFGMVIAVGVVYNNARVALSERARDLATLRVLGYTRAEVSVVLLAQLAWQTLVAIPVGLAFGYGLASMFMASMDPEQFRWPTIVSAETYAFAALVVIGSTLATGLVVKRRLDAIDMVDALKARD